MCPHCKTNAPLVYRGLRATCSACGKKRTVLTGSSLTHAGKPSSVGGSLVRAFGLMTLVFGLFFSVGVGLLIALVATTATPGLVIGGFLAFVTLVAFLVLNMGGKKLEESGKETQEARREQALFALAQNRGGVLQAMDAASALDLSVDEADGFLTRMAKQKPDVVGVDIGDQGEVFYTFVQAMPGGGIAWGHVATRVGGAGPARQVRIDTEPREVASAPRPRPITAERKIIDAEFEAIEEEDAAARARRRS